MAHSSKSLKYKYFKFFNIQKSQLTSLSRGSRLMGLDMSYLEQKQNHHNAETYICCLFEIFGTSVLTDLTAASLHYLECATCDA